MKEFKSKPNEPSPQLRWGYHRDPESTEEGLLFTVTWNDLHGQQKFIPILIPPDELKEMIKHTL